MSIENEINNFEFESIPSESSIIIKNGFHECYKNIIGEDLEDLWLNNTDVLAVALENIVDKEIEYPETFIEVLDIFEYCKDIIDTESLNILRLKKFNQLSSHYITNPFLVSVIEVLYNNIDESIELEDFFSELVDLSKIITKSL